MSDFLDGAPAIPEFDAARDAGLFLGRRPGLREDILRRRGEMRTLQTNRQENAARFWERQLDLQEQLVKKFGSLGVV